MYHDWILRVLLATNGCIPVTRKPVIASWNDEAEPARDEATFWHKLWIENGRPTHGVIAYIRCDTRFKCS